MTETRSLGHCLKRTERVWEVKLASSTGSGRRCADEAMPAQWCTADISLQTSGFDTCTLSRSTPGTHPQQRALHSCSCFLGQPAPHVTSYSHTILYDIHAKHIGARTRSVWETTSGTWKLFATSSATTGCMFDDDVCHV